MGLENYNPTPEKIPTKDTKELRQQLIDSTAESLTEPKREIEKQRETISPKAFLQLKLEDRLKMVSDIDSWENLKDGTRVSFNFGSNRKLEYQVGLGDLMPSHIRKITVNGKEYERKGNQGFYHNGKYLAIFNNSAVTITEKNENYNAAQEHAEIFGTNYNENLQEKIEGVEITKAEIYEVAKDFSIDPYLLEAVVSIIKEDRSFQIKDPFEFANMAARYIQNAENRFINSPAETPAIVNGAYSAEFVAYSLDHFNLFNSHSPFNPYRKACFNKYMQLTGLDYEYPEEKSVLESTHNAISALEAFNIDNPENITNAELIDKFQTFSADQLLELRAKAKPEKLKDLFKETGLKNYTQKEEVFRAINKQVDNLSPSDRLVQLFGSKENLKTTIQKIAAVESSFKAFNWSRTDCMGFFQFTKANTERYKVNPLNPQQAVQGLLELWKDNAKYIGDSVTAEKLIKAHNTGHAKTAEGKEYLARVQKVNLEAYNDEKNAIILDQTLDALSLESAPSERSSSGTTLCSRTAAKNLQLLGIKSPIRGNAIDVKKHYQSQNISKIEGSNNGEIAQNLDNIANKEKIQAIDLIVQGSNSEAGRKYGHRAVAYLGVDGNWKVLDPYRNKGRQGVDMQDYSGKIEFAVPYFST